MQDGWAPIFIPAKERSVLNLNQPATWDHLGKIMPGRRLRLFNRKHIVKPAETIGTPNRFRSSNCFRSCGIQARLPVFLGDCK